MTAVLVLAATGSTLAAPYFRTIVTDPSKAQVSVGACADPVNVGHSTQCTVVATVYHSHTDGYLLIPGEDWTLLGVGYAVSGEGVSLILGPSWNMTPAAAEVVVGTLSKIFPNKFAPNAADLFSSSVTNLSLSFGPAFGYDALRNKGAFRLFAGASWKFN